MELLSASFYEGLLFKILTISQVFWGNLIKKLDKNSNSSQDQYNAGIWIVVIVGVVIIAAFMAACAVFKMKFTGEFSFIGFAFKIKCG
ncbi:hypothetical protein ATZ33_13420 [Enterococcus silesiacus]|uniref:Uncharacterized protein n=1 Tax=Enterococcus silesiacus TaxID=332949 RepID=A0A0S3KDJ5_9ENTE|nr:hypothetical protein [Enterococcus silesiacus]ALS02348.1 hypothetical protein ATZ33_13420 [Enterococcus silesiacus]OJG91322.1 hypothetical protein RV15_GL000778 [Enterococcus silesiacus]